MTPKQFTMSKIILTVAWAASLFVVVLVLNWIFNNTDKITTPIASVLTATIGVFGGIPGYITKWYLKKTTIENEPKVRLGVMQEAIKLQMLYPTLKIYDSQQAKIDFNNIVNPIKNDEQRTYESRINEDIGTKI